MRASRTSGVAGGICIASLLFAGVVPASLPARADTSGVPSADWRTYNRTLEGDRYSPLDQLTAANVAQLRRVCTYDLGDSLSFQTGPVVVDGVMYFTTDTATYAMDAATCRERWRRGTGQQPGYLRVNRGVAYDGGRIFRGVFDDTAGSRGWITAVDADSGTVLWSDQTNNAIGGGVVTYAVGGKQYVAVAAGLHAANWPAPAQTNRIVVYALP